MKSSIITLLAATGFALTVVLSGCSTPSSPPEPTRTAQLGVPSDLGLGLQGETPKENDKPLERNTTVALPSLDTTKVQVNEKINISVNGLPKDKPYKIGLAFQGKNAKNSFIDLKSNDTKFDGDTMTGNLVIPSNLTAGKYMLSVEITISKPDVDETLYKSAIYDAPIEVEK